MRGKTTRGIAGVGTVVVLVTTITIVLLRKGNTELQSSKIPVDPSHSSKGGVFKQSSNMRSNSGKVRISVSHVIGKRAMADVKLAFDGEGLPIHALEGATDSNGYFERELPPGKYGVKAYWASSTESEHKEFFVVADSVSQVEISFDTCPLVLVHGIVRTADGKSVGNANVVMTYDPEEESHPLVDKLLGGEGSLITTADESGTYEIRRFLYPRKYELYARSPVHEPLKDASLNCIVPSTEYFITIHQDIIVKALLFTDVSGRILGPDGIPVKGFKFAIRKMFCNDQGKVTGYLESSESTNQDGMFTYRTTHDRLRFVAAHPMYQFPSVDIHLNLVANANKTTRIDDVVLQEKQTTIVLRLVSDTAGIGIQEKLEVHEFEGGSDDIVSFGNTSFALTTDATGQTSLRIDPNRRYLFKVEGHLVLSVTGDVLANRARGVVAFPPQGGNATILVRRP